MAEASAATRARNSSSLTGLVKNADAPDLMARSRTTGRRCWSGRYPRRRSATAEPVLDLEAAHQRHENVDHCYSRRVFLGVGKKCFRIFKAFHAPRLRLEQSTCRLQYGCVVIKEANFVTVILRSLPTLSLVLRYEKRIGRKLRGFSKGWLIMLLSLKPEQAMCPSSDHSRFPGGIAASVYSKFGLRSPNGSLSRKLLWQALQADGDAPRARWTAARKVESSKGLIKKANAPPCMTVSFAPGSSRPVMKMTWVCGARAARCTSNSIPVIGSIQMSRIATGTVWPLTKSRQASDWLKAARKALRFEEAADRFQDGGIIVDDTNHLRPRVTRAGGGGFSRVYRMEHWEFRKH